MAGLVFKCFLRPSLFNQSSYSVFTHSLCDLPSSVDLPVGSETLYRINISAADVFQALHSLDPNKASGIDSINPALLKYCIESLIAPIYQILEK